MSISKAMQINTMLAMLSKEEAVRVQAVYNKTRQGTVSQSQFLKTIKEAMKENQSNNQSNNQSQSQSNNQSQTQGLVLNVRVSIFYGHGNFFR
jgi:hypothetical protein